MVSTRGSSKKNFCVTGVAFIADITLTLRRLSREPGALWTTGDAVGSRNPTVARLRAEFVGRLRACVNALRHRHCLGSMMLTFTGRRMQRGGQQRIDEAERMTTAGEYLLRALW